MMRGMFSAISGLKNHQVMLDVTANDIANVNTIGYKSARTTFKDSLTQLQRGASGAGGANGGTNAAQVGLGVGLGSIDNLMTGGALAVDRQPARRRDPGRGLLPRRPGRDAAGDAVPAGTVAQYTRAGNFTHERGRLPAHAGGLLRPRPHRPRRRRRRHSCCADPGRRHERRDRPGRLGHLHPGRRRRARDRGLPRRSPRSQNAAGLERASGNRWLASANSGAAQVDTPGNGGKGLTSAGAIEMSNVDLAQTFTSMITAQRGFQANSRVISTSDEMLQDLVNLKR